MSDLAQFKNFPKEWNVMTFLDAIKDVTGGNTKIKQSDACKTGIYPVIDQGQQACCGYVDDDNALCKEELPTVLFGDHTKIIKLIDYPFVLGADGVKVLSPKVPMDKKFLFHFLKTIKLPVNAGYSRHYKFLKEAVIPVPPLAEQIRIAAILDKADSLRRKNQQAIQLADQFLRAVFLELFGDPVSNPKRWAVEPFGNVGILDRGKSKHRPRNDSILLGGVHPLIQTGDVANSNGYIRKFTSTYSDAGLKQSRKWSSGTLCITIAANIAKTGILTFDACFPDSVVGFLPSDKVTVEYIQHWLRFLQQSLESSAPESAQKNINLEILRNLNLPVPNKCLQEKFSTIVNGVLKVENDFSNSVNMSTNLFSSLSQKAFAGEL
jgi:type I restriction enzyme S subunit